jgi:hypothetical protein
VWVMRCDGLVLIGRTADDYRCRCWNKISANCLNQSGKELARPEVV